jgi:hypothetical protein
VLADHMGLPIMEALPRVVDDLILAGLKQRIRVVAAGITTHNKRLQRGLVVQEKFQRVANYAAGMNREIEMIAHVCGLRHARELRREHVRLVQRAGSSMAMNMLYPYPLFSGAEEQRAYSKPIGRVRYNRKSLFFSWLPHRYELTLRSICLPAGTSC